MRAPLRAMCLVLLVGLLASCGGDDDNVASGGGSSTTESTSAGGGTGTIEPGPGGTVSGSTATTSAGGATTTASRNTSTTSGTTALGPTGVRGVVLAGPTCPVQREGDTSCDDQPIPARIKVTQGTRVVNAGVSGDDGRFALVVRPGRYTVAASSERAMSCADQDVTVPDGGWADITVRCDTGIR